MYFKVPWCLAIVENVGNHLMSEHSVVWSPDELTLFFL